MQIKAPLPLNNLAGKHPTEIIALYFEFNHLKNLYRQGWLRQGISPERCESVADHAFGVALLALFLAEAHFPHLDADKVLRMALLHDLGEIYAGDFTPHDNISPAEKYRLEQASVLQVVGKLPRSKIYLDLWEEFEAGESLEAQFVRQLDRLEMALQASVYQSEDLADLSQFYDTAQTALTHPRLQMIMSEIISLIPPRKEPEADV